MGGDDLPPPIPSRDLGQGRPREGHREHRGRRRRPATVIARRRGGGRKGDRGERQTVQPGAEAAGHRAEAIDEPPAVLRLLRPCGDQRRQPAREPERSHDERSQERSARRRRAHRDHDERPVAEEREEPDAEPRAVEERRQGPSEVGAPPVGHLTPELRDGNAETRELSDEVQDGHRGDDHSPGPPPRSAEECGHGCRGSAERRRGRRRPCGVQRQSACPPGPRPVHDGADGLHHRQASGTPERGPAGGRRGGRQQDDSRSVNTPS